MSTQVKFVQGNEACVEGALYADWIFLPGTPSPRHRKLRNYWPDGCRPRGANSSRWKMNCVDSCDHRGLADRSQVMTATSGPGFSLMQEALGYAVMAEIPCVITNVQRGGPSTGIPPTAVRGM